MIYQGWQGKSNLIQHFDNFTIPEIKNNPYSNEIFTNFRMKTLSDILAERNYKQYNEELKETLQKFYNDRISRWQENLSQN